MMGGSSAEAQTLVSTQQLTASRPLPSDENRVRVWAVRDDDHLVSVWQDSGNNWHWTDHGLVPSPPEPQLAAVSYELGSDHHERVWFVGADGKLHELDVLNNATATWTSYDPPTGATFTGQIAAMKGTYFNQWLTVGLTTTDGTLRRAVGSASVHDLNYVASGSGYDTTSQITATVSAAENVWTVFARKTNGTVGFFRWTGFGWVTGNAGAPSDVDVGWSLAAAQGPLSSSTYGLHLWATADVPENEVRVALATSASDTTFVWTHTNTGAAPAGIFGLAAASRPNGSFSALDGFVHAVDDHLYRDTRTSSSWPWNAVDLGTGLEIESNAGDSVTALGTGFGYSRVAWLGRMGGASYLYSRMGNGGPDELWRYEAHGDDPSPQRRINSGSVPHTEVMMDDWRGRSLAAAMVRPDNGDPNPNDDFSYIQAMWSDDDGETWGAPVTMSSTAEGLSYNYQADPTVAFTDTGKAFVAWINVQFPGNFDLSNIDRQAVVFTTTTDGSTYTAPTVVASGDGTPVMDHPWMEIDRSRSPNRLHFIWWDGYSAGPTMYTCLDDGATCPTTSTDCCQAPCSTPPCLGPTRDLSTEWGIVGGPPTMTVGGDGSVYAAWSPQG